MNFETDLNNIDDFLDPIEGQNIPQELLDFAQEFLFEDEATTIEGECNNY
jgi:hypothetical protein